MYYKNYDEVETRFERESKRKYNKKRGHSRSTENYSRKGKHKFNTYDVDY